MKYLVLSILLVLGIASCKVATSDNAQTSTDNTAQPVKDLGELYQYYHTNPITQDQIDENLIIEYAANNDLKPIRTESGLYYIILKEGTGELIQADQRIEAHYKGTFLDGKEFDSSYKRGKPIVFNIGQMIAGWNEGILYMKPNSKAMFLVPSRLAYRDRGFANMVPPNTVLKFELETLRVQ